MIFFLVHLLNLFKYVGVCTNRSAAMTGRITEFKAEVLKVSPGIQFVHFIIHRKH